MSKHKPTENTSSQHTEEDTDHPASENAPLEHASDDSSEQASTPLQNEGSLEDQIELLKAEKAALHEQWVRAVAETDNVRKRAKREQEETSKFAVTQFAREMVNVLENMIRASESIPKESRKEHELLETLGEGIDLTLQELLSIFEKNHIQRIHPLNEKFDHNLHQAVVQVEQNDTPPGTVVQVVQSGYRIHDRLLRPAMVAVSKQGSDTANDTGDNVDTSA